MFDALVEARDRFVEMQEAGEAFALRDLPTDHPVVLFAHQVNPEAYLAGTLA